MRIYLRQDVNQTFLTKHQLSRYPHLLVRCHIQMQDTLIVESSGRRRKHLNESCQHDRQNARNHTQVILINIQGDTCKCQGVDSQILTT